MGSRLSEEAGDIEEGGEGFEGEEGLVKVGSEWVYTLLGFQYFLHLILNFSDILAQIFYFILPQVHNMF